MGHTAMQYSYSWPETMGDHNSKPMVYNKFLFGWSLMGLRLATNGAAMYPHKNPVTDPWATAKTLWAVHWVLLGYHQNLRGSPRATPTTSYPWVMQGLIWATHGLSFGYPWAALGYVWATT